MYIQKLSIVVCETGFVILDETDDEADPFPIAGFGQGQLPDAFDFMRATIEIEMEGRAEDLRKFQAAQAAHAAQVASGNVVAGPGFKAPAPPEAPPHTIVASADGNGTTVLDLHGSEHSVLLDWIRGEAHFTGAGGDTHKTVQITRPVKTDREIVDEVNDVARFMLSQMGTGYLVDDGFKFYRSEGNTRAGRAWTQAADVYQQITGSEVSDALQAVLEEEELSNAPVPAAEPVA